MLVLNEGEVCFSERGDVSSVDTRMDGQRAAILGPEKASLSTGQ